MPFLSRLDLINLSYFGDASGFVNTLFSGLALLAISFSIFTQIEAVNIQKKDLELAREEMKLTRQELKKTSNAQNKSQEALNLQVKLMTKQILNENNKLLFSITNEILILRQQGRSAGFSAFAVIEERISLKEKELAYIEEEIREMKKIHE